MTAEQIIQKIESENLKAFFFNQEYYLLMEDYSGGDYDQYGFRTEDDGLFGTTEEAKNFIANMFGTVVEVDQRCDSSEMWSVIYFSDHNVYIKIDGEFNSYDMYSHSYDSKPTQVFPKTIEKTIYE